MYGVVHGCTYTQTGDGGSLVDDYKCGSIGLIYLGARQNSKIKQQDKNSKDPSINRSWSKRLTYIAWFMNHGQM